MPASSKPKSCRDSDGGQKLTHLCDGTPHGAAVSNFLGCSRHQQRLCRRPRCLTHLGKPQSMRADGGLRGEKDDTSLDMHIDKGKLKLRKIEADTVWPLNGPIPCRASPLWQEFQHSSMAAETTRRSRAHHHRVRWRALECRDPSTIIPNHHPHTAHVACTPSASTDSRCSYLTRAGCRARGWRRLEEQHGPRTSSILLRAGAKPWPGLEGPQPPPPAGAEPVYGFRDRFFSSQPRRTGPQGGVRVSEGRITYVHVGMLVFVSSLYSGGVGSTLWSIQKAFHEPTHSLRTNHDQKQK